MPYRPPYGPPYGPLYGPPYGPPYGPLAGEIEGLSYAAESLRMPTARELTEAGRQDVLLAILHH
eukprot:630133-Pyramimonas_sp.AAC.1